MKTKLLKKVRKRFVIQEITIKGKDTKYRVLDNKNKYVCYEFNNLDDSYDMLKWLISHNYTDIIRKPNIKKIWYNGKRI